MTVKVRQLVPVSSGTVPPPIPPVPPTMSFVQQPTDTAVNQPFSPPISVQISDGAEDLLIIGNFSGTCNLGTQYAVADSNGLATFTGFSAGPFTSGEVGCMLSVTNLTRPQIPMIISDTFHVTTVVPAWQLLSTRTAITTSNTFVTIDGFNTVGVNLIVVIGWYFIIPNQPIFCSIYETGTGNFLQDFVQLTPIRGTQERNEVLQAFYLVNPIEAPNRTIGLNTDAPNGQLTYPAMLAYGFHATGVPTLVLEGIPFSNVMFSGTQIQSATPATIDFNNALVVTAFNDLMGTASIPSDPAYELTSINNGGDIGITAAWKLAPNPSVQNPLWVSSTFVTGWLLMNLLAFQSV